LWHNVEKPFIIKGLQTGKVTELNMYLSKPSELIPLGSDEIETLMAIKGNAP
jgi:hypothetical protein